MKNFTNVTFDARGKSRELHALFSCSRGLIGGGYSAVSGFKEKYLFFFMKILVLVADI